MPVTALELTLQRSAPGPWGLRLQGGLDFDKALVISHVTEGTHSSLSGLMVQCSMGRNTSKYWGMGKKRSNSGILRVVK